MKYYIDNDGNYIGGWDSNPPDGLIEVPLPPDDANQIWNFQSKSWSLIKISYQKALEQISLKFQSDVDSFNRAFSVAGMLNGNSQSNKQAAIRQEYNLRRTQYAAEISSLKLEYGV
jgi:hypothetical protein